MSQAPKDTRSAAEKARDTAGIIGSFMHEGYVPNPEDEAIYQQAERGEITTEEAIAIFRERALERERKALARKRPQAGGEDELAQPGCSIGVKSTQRAGHTRR